MSPQTFEVAPRGAFSLDETGSRFGGWVDADRTLAFALEGWDGSAAVLLSQDEDGTVRGEVHGDGDMPPPDFARRAWEQALAVLSLDVDGAGFAAVGEADPVIGGLQRRYAGLRPVLFHSPYEAAAAFTIGHRISIVQGRAVRRRMAERLGAAIDTPSGTVHAFPGPERVLQLAEFPGIPALKVERLHGVARAALDGLLDRSRLRSMEEAEALAAIRTIPGIGPFFAQGILMRGAGLVDAVTDDEITKKAVARAYGLPAPPSQREVLEIAERWRPYRMWATVLLHVWFRSDPR